MKKRTWGILGVILALLYKLKGLLLVFLKPLIIAFKYLKFVKFLGTGVSMVISIWFYAMAWGWRFAVGFVLLIFLHELGHAIALWRRGIKAGAPVFIPFVGAFISMKEMPRNVYLEAETAFAGPLFGTLATLVPYGLARSTHHPFWLNLAYSGFFLNLFNLFPVLPLDGGRVAAAISPKIWLAGLVVAAGWLFWRFNPILLILILLSLPRAIEAFRGRGGEYYEIPQEKRMLVMASYVGLALFLGTMLLATHEVPTLNGEVS